MLDVGCGWGSLAIHAARKHTACRSPASRCRSRRPRWRASARPRPGVGDRVDIRVMDYRELAGEPYDKIASIGMVEHVGSVQIDEYMRTLHRLLRPGGQLLNHGIARLRVGEPEAGPFSERYVFPDAAPLHLSRIQTASSAPAWRRSTSRASARTTPRRCATGRAGSTSTSRRASGSSARSACASGGSTCAPPATTSRAASRRCTRSARPGRSYTAVRWSAFCRPRGSSLAWVPPVAVRVSSRLPNRSRPMPQEVLMSQQSFADLGVSRAVAARARSSAASTRPSPSRSSSSPTCSPAATCSPSRPPAPARRSPSACRSSTAIAADARRPAALVLAPTRELASQIVDELRAAGARPQPLRRRRLRRRRLREADARRRDAPTSSSPPPAGSRTCSSAAPSRSTTSARSSSTRPTACSTWASARPSTASSRLCPRRAADAVLLRHARRRGRPRRPRLHARRRSATSTRRRSSARPTSSTASWRSSATTGSTRWSASCRPTTASCALVFVRTKRGADRLVRRLSGHGVDAVAMHGDKSQRQREKALASFEAGRVDTLIATDVAARGIDVERHLARHQLRPAGRPRGLRPPHRPHGPRRHAPASASRSSAPSTSATSRRSRTSCG